MIGMGEFLGGLMVRTLNFHCRGLVEELRSQMPKKQTRKDSNGKFYVIYILRACMLSHFSHVQLFATLWIVACHSPLSTGFSRQEYWIGKPALLQGISPTLGSNPHLLHWQAVSLPLVQHVYFATIKKKF